MSPIRWVAQEDPWGCTVAALAMVLGRTYADVKAWVLWQWPDRDLNTKGLNYMDADQILLAEGYATARMFPYCVGRYRSEWPPAPFGELHWCEVQVSEEAPAHSVLMLADGSVLDPLTPERRRLTDYPKVWNVAAIVRFREPE